MRSTFAALVIAAGLAGFGATAKAAPTPAADLSSIATAAPIVNVQMMRRERRMMRHRMMRHRMMRHRMMRHRMMRRRMNRM